jgi:hypothetical protein
MQYIFMKFTTKPVLLDKKMKFITMTGMSRSGNHGFIRWLTAHYEEAGYSVYFYNNTVVAFLEHLNFVMPHVEKSVKKVLLVSLEDVAINQRFSTLSSSADHNILLVRDPANLFASRLKGLAPDRGLAIPETASESERMMAATLTHKSLPSQIEKYQNHYGEFCKSTNFLKKKICVSYNQWVVDEKYRRSIVEQDFGLSFSDSRYKTRAGSSFGSPPSSTEEYLDRWKTCWENWVYDHVRSSKNLIDISKEFGVNFGGMA